MGLHWKLELREENMDVKAISKSAQKIFWGSKSLFWITHTTTEIGAETLKYVDPQRG
jgi:hypothetical protein